MGDLVQAIPSVLSGGGYCGRRATADRRSRDGARQDAGQAGEVRFADGDHREDAVTATDRCAEAGHKNPPKESTPRDARRGHVRTGSGSWSEGISTHPRPPGLGAARLPEPNLDLRGGNLPKAETLEAQLGLAMRTRQSCHRASCGRGSWPDMGIEVAPSVNADDVSVASDGFDSDSAIRFDCSGGLSEAVRDVWP